MATLIVDHAVVGEADGYIDIVVRLLDAGTLPVTVNYATDDTSAIYYGSGSDYTYTTGTLTFAAGETTKTVRVFINNNSVIEGYETFNFNLSNATNATIGRTQAVIGIVDNDTVVGTPSLSVRDVTVDERAGTATFAVILGGIDGQASNKSVSVNYATASGTAVAGSDFTAQAGSLTFAPGDTVKNIVVPIGNDGSNEGSERFFLNLSGATNATLLDTQGVATIGASDATALAQPRITVGDMTVSESDGWAEVVVSLSAPGQNVVSVNYVTRDGSADYYGTGWDYAYTNGTLNFAQGETTKVVRIQLADNTTSEGYEHFRLNLSAAQNAVIGDESALIGIVDDDTVVSTPNLFVRDLSVDEKAGTASFAVLLGGPDGQASNGVVRVNYAAASGTAVAGSDFAATSGTLTFAPGETVKQVVVDIADDGSNEGVERLFLNLSGATGATILDAQGVATIGASDATAVAQPRVSVGDMIVSESDGWADVVVSLSAPGQNVVSVNYATQDVSADYYGTGWDYAYTNGTLTFAQGETTKVVRIQIAENTTSEGYETFRFNLGTVQNAVVANESALIGIVDDDTVVTTPNLFVRDLSVDEKAGTASFAVLLGGPEGQASNGVVRVNYATASGTAVAGADFAATSGTLTFAAGETVKQVVVDIADDAMNEGAERLLLNLSGATGATILDAQGVATLGPSDATSAAQPRITVDDMIVGESDGWAEVVVSLSAPGQNVVSVDYATQDVSADYYGTGWDYAYTNGTLTFAQGETTKVVRIQIADNTVSEAFETLRFNLSRPVNAVIDDTRGLIGIVDDDNVVDTAQLYAGDAVVDEKAGTATFTVTLGATAGQSSNGTITVNYATASSTAVTGADFAATSGTLVFAPGETVKTVVVDIADDPIPEALERIDLTLSGAVGATIADSRAVAEIGANDAQAVAQPNITVDDVIVAESDGYVDMVVRLSAPSANPVTVSYVTRDGTAIYYGTNWDYAYTSGSLTFGSGETTQTVRIQINDDGLVEQLENLTFDLYSADGATIERPSTSIGIVDNDTGGVNVFSYGRSDDIYTIRAAGDVIVENPGGGTDLVRSPVTYTLGAQVENLALIGSSGIRGTGNSLANAITGNTAGNTLNGGSGNDTLDGGAGADTMIGGSGDDKFSVDDAGDIVNELAGAGTDHVESNRSYTLPANVENLTLTGSATAGTGNSLNNAIVGNAQNNRLSSSSGNDTLDGGAGADTMTGGSGNDTYTADNAGDSIVEAAGGGTDTVIVNRSFTLASNLENLTLNGSAVNGIGNAVANIIVGNDFANRLEGRDGDDRLEGGAGTDTMIGGNGNDTFVVDKSADSVTELAGGGTDSVLSGVSYTLSANLENLTLTGSATAGTGNSGANTITGNAVNNRLTGGAGNDAIDGAAGSDTMIGGTGDDTFGVDNLGDVVSESSGAGNDTVRSSLQNYTLASNVENLVLGGSSSINGAGNSLANTITGNNAANLLDGGSGADRMIGLAGNDSYVVNTGSDVIVEAANGGTDTVRSSISFTLGVNLERLVLTGGNAINGTGNSLANQLTGNSAANVLAGGAGSDRLAGGAGRDIFHFDSRAGSDTITDFRSADDTFRFSQGTLRIGDGDRTVDNGLVFSGYGNFSVSAEVVVFTQNLFGPITAEGASAYIGYANGNFSQGSTRLFVVDNGSESAIYRFTSSSVDAYVSSTELALVASFNGTTTALSDFVFSS
jgi:Ca2+-binding RTX toxin-like protein